MNRPDLGDRVLIALIVGAAVALVFYFAVVHPALPKAWRTPGNPELYLLGVAGAALLLVSMVFVVVKRTGRGGSPPAWFIAHVVCGTIGTVLVAIHSAGLEQACWRPLHLALAYVFVFGLIIHFVTVTFFAGYVDDGDKVKVETAHGSIEAIAWLTTGIRETSVFVPIGWGERQPYHPWRSVNFLTDKTQRDPISDQTNLKSLLCRMSRT
jgi:hypothetical protein